MYSSKEMLCISKEVLCRSKEGSLRPPCHTSSSIPTAGSTCWPPMGTVTTARPFSVAAAAHPPANAIATCLSSASEPNVQHMDLSSRLPPPLPWVRLPSHPAVNCKADPTASTRTLSMA